MPEQNWSLRGEYMESCNCDYLCPCVYTNPQGPATYDNCTAVMVFRIDDGRSGATRLDGLKFALVIRSGKVMADGNWIFGAVVDAAADPAQRQALSAIASGEAGGPPSVIRQNLVSDFRGVEFKPIEFTMAGLTRRVDPGVDLLRDRGGGLAQWQRRPVLPRQCRTSGRPPARPGAVQGNPHPCLRPRPRSGGPGQ